MEHQKPPGAPHVVVNHFTLQQSLLDHPPSLWGRRARFVANVQSIFIGINLFSLTILCVLSYSYYAINNLTEAIKWTLFLAISIDLWGVCHLSKSLDPELHPLLALRYAYTWRNINYFFLMVDCAFLVGLFRPLIAVGLHVAAVVIFAILVLIATLLQATFIYIVGKYIGQLEAATKTAISLTSSAPPTTASTGGTRDNLMFENMMRV